MDDDIIIEPGKEPTWDGATPTIQQSTDATEVVQEETKYNPDQVFEISADLNILPVQSDAPVEIKSTKPKKIDPIIDTPVNVSKKQNFGIPPPKPITPVTPAIVTVPKVSTTPTITTETSPTIPTTIAPPAATITPPIVTQQQSYPSTPNAEKTIPGLSGMRTYEGDVAKTITSRGTSAIDMAMAEKRRDTGEEDVLTSSEPQTSHKKSIIIIISLILILTGIGGSYYLYSISPLAAVAPPAIQIKAASLVPKDSQVTVAIDRMTSNEIVRALKEKISSQQSPGTIMEVVPYTTDINGTKSRIPTQQMIKNMRIPAPDILVRSLTSSWMLGVFADSNNNKNVFIVVKNNYFQNAFAGMLEWENVMADDLKQYLFSVAPLGVANSTSPVALSPTLYSDALQNIDSILPSTGSIGTTTQENVADSSTTPDTTPVVETPAPVIPYFTLRGQFQDKIVKNKDTREFITTEGETILLYSFIDNNRTVISTNEATLAEIILRLEREAYVR